MENNNTIAERALQSLKKYPEALSELEQAARLAPGSADAHYSLGLLYEAAASDPALVGVAKSPAARTAFSRKAREAWERVARHAKDPKRAATAKEHLARIADALR